LSGIKEETKRIIDTLPENITPKELTPHLSFELRLKNAKEQVEQGRTKPYEEILKRAIEK